MYVKDQFPEIFFLGGGGVGRGRHMDTDPDPSVTDPDHVFFFKKRNIWIRSELPFNQFPHGIHLGVASRQDYGSVFCLSKSVDPDLVLLESRIWIRSWLPLDQFPNIFLVAHLTLLLNNFHQKNNNNKNK